MFGALSVSRLFPRLGCGRKTAVVCGSKGTLAERGASKGVQHNDIPSKRGTRSPSVNSVSLQMGLCFFLFLNILSALK